MSGTAHLKLYSALAYAVTELSQYSPVKLRQRLSDDFVLLVRTSCSYLSCPD
jgi:hypothetical protein